jgi:hypothetical protein
MGQSLMQTLDPVNKQLFLKLRFVNARSIIFAACLQNSFREADIELGVALLLKFLAERLR